METINASALRKNLKTKLDAVSIDKLTIIIHRSAAEDVVMLPLSQFNNLQETMYLLSTKANKQHLELSIDQVKKGNVITVKTNDLWK